MIVSALRFTLILTTPANSIVPIEEALWLSIESAAEEPEDTGSRPLPAKDSPLAALTASLNDVALEPQSKSMALVLPSTKATGTKHLMKTDHRAGSSPVILRESQRMGDLCSVQNLCLYLRQQLQESILSSSSPTCLGFLQKTEAFMRYMYSVPRSPPGHRRSSLHDVLLLAESY